MYTFIVSILFMYFDEEDFFKKNIWHGGIEI